MGELFRMVGISKSFPGVKALDDVSFSIDEGEVHGLVGENGAGKSTLMKIMSGVYRADGGEIYIKGVKVDIDGVESAQRLGVGIIFQELNLCPHMTVADNIFIGRPPNRGWIIRDRELHRQAGAVLDELGIKLDTRAVVRELSIAKQQMVEIAKAISRHSRILVLDEPTAALSEKEIQHLFQIIRNLQKKGVGMVYISHRMNELSQICRRVTVLRDGRCIGTRVYSELPVDELVRMIVGRPLENMFPKYERKIGEVRLEALNLRRGNVVNVDRLRVRRGEILGVAGLMGSGRSEIVRAIFGADPFDSKEMWLDGRKVEVRSPLDAIRNGLGYVTEDRKLDGLALGLDVLFNINMAHIDEISTLSFIRDREGRDNALRYIDALRIKTPGLYQLARNLSGGNQQKVVLAKWLCNQVKVMIMDEPTRGIDVGAKFEVYELMNRLSDQGVGIIMISSDMPEILGMSDRIAVVHEGSINGEMSAGEATQEKIMFLAAGYNKSMGASTRRFVGGAFRESAPG